MKRNIFSDDSFRHDSDRARLIQGQGPKCAGVL